MLELKLNPKDKNLEVEILLKGEVEPLKLKIDSYEIRREGGKSFITLREIKTSREWLDVVVKNFIENREFEIPNSIEEMVGILA